MLIEARNQASISDHHGHFHLQVVHLMALVVAKLLVGETIIHVFLHGNWICLPSLPMLFREAIATELDNCDSKTIIVEGLTRNVVASCVLTGHAILLKVIQVVGC